MAATASSAHSMTSQVPTYTTPSSPTRTHYMDVNKLTKLLLNESHHWKILTTMLGLPDHLISEWQSMHNNNSTQCTHELAKHLAYQRKINIHDILVAIEGPSIGNNALARDTRALLKNNALYFTASDQSNPTTFSTTQHHGPHADKQPSAPLTQDQIKLEQLQQQLRAQQDEAKQTIERLQAEQKQSTQKLEFKNSSIKELQQKVSNLSAQVHSLQRKNQQQQTEISKLTASLAALKQQNDELRNATTSSAATQLTSTPTVTVKPPMDIDAKVDELVQGITTQKGDRWPLTVLNAIATHDVTHLWFQIGQQLHVKGLQSIKTYNQPDIRACSQMLDAAATSLSYDSSNGGDCGIGAQGMSRGIFKALIQSNHLETAQKMAESFKRYHGE